ncbi:hypothetical protein [Aliiruegeria haliotis]|nr:hypothetical protein [Aliiruegeria haliotis]
MRSAPGAVVYPDLTEALAHRQDRKVLLPVAAPCVAVASALQGSALPGEAIEQWMAKTRDTLALLVEAGEQVVVIESSGLLRGEGRNWTVLSAEFGLSCPPAGGVEMPATAGQMAQFLASAILARHPKARRLAAELNARLKPSVDLPEPDFRILDSEWAARTGQKSDLTATADGGQPQITTPQASEQTAEIGLLRDSLGQTMNVIRELEEEVERLKGETADHYIQVAMTDVVRTQLNTLWRESKMREAVLGMALLEDARSARAQAAEQKALREALQAEIERLNPSGTTTATSDGLTDETPQQDPE